MKTAVVYARYSCDNQTEQSIEGQLRVCKEYADRNDITIVDTYIDRATTGTNDNRAAFQKMMKDSGKKQWDIVLVYKLDRFSRDIYASAVNKHTLKQNGVRLVSAMEDFPDTPEGELMQSVLEGFNQYFSKELAQKVNRGIRESWIKGLSTGGQPIFGYDVVDKRYVINKEEAEIVIEIFTKYSQGYVARVIAEDLRAKGVRAKKGMPIDRSHVYFILHNSRYTGKVTHYGIEYDKIFPRIISDELWHKVDLINQDNKIAPSRKKEKRGYILSGKLVCGYCKERMCGVSGTSETGEKHYYYKCLTKRKDSNKCASKTVKKQWIEDTVINITTDILRRDGGISKIAEEIFKRQTMEREKDMKIKILEKEKAEAEKASKNIIKAIEQGIITDMTKERLRELDMRIKYLAGEIAAEKLKNYAYLTKEQIEKYLQSKLFIGKDSGEARKAVVNTFIREIILYKDKIIITYNFIDNKEPTIINKEETEKIEKRSKTASFNTEEKSSSIDFAGEPQKKSTDIVVLFFYAFSPSDANGQCG